MQLQQAYDLFIADRKISGCSPKTIAFYNDSAGGFIRLRFGLAGATKTSTAYPAYPIFLLASPSLLEWSQRSL